MGLFLLRRSSSMCSLEAEVSRTTENAFLPWISLGSLCNAESNSKSGGQSCGAGERQMLLWPNMIQFLPASCYWPSQAASSSVFLPPKTSSVMWGTWVSSTDNTELQPALGIEEGWVGKPPAGRLGWTRVCICQKPMASFICWQSSCSWERKEGWLFWKAVALPGDMC